MSAIADHANYITTAAKIAVELGGMNASDALDYAARQAIASGTAARTRDGIWAYETSGQQIDDVLFTASVAKDILDGTVSRPSVGNVRQYALSLI